MKRLIALRALYHILGIAAVVGAVGCARHAPEFTATPNPVMQGGMVALCLNGAPAGSVAVVDQSVGAVDPSKCANVRPQSTTTYTMRVAVPGGGINELTQTVVVRERAGAPQAKLVRVEPAQYTGNCPATLAFVGQISLRGRGSNVEYRLALSDGRSSKGDVRVRSDGKSPIRLAMGGIRNDGWAEVVVVSPAGATLNRVPFKVHCVHEVPPERIWAIAKARRCQPNSGRVGPGCAWTVNQVVAQVIKHTVPPATPPYTCGGPNWDPQPPHRCSEEWVPDIVQMIVEHGAGRQIRQSETQRGDIAVQDGTHPQRGMNHIGFCEDTGCHSVLSNKSSTGTLCGETNPSMSDNGYPYPSGPDYPPTFYRLAS